MKIGHWLVRSDVVVLYLFGRLRTDGWPVKITFQLLNRDGQEYHLTLVFWNNEER
jgi:hypothetical protein